MQTTKRKPPFYLGWECEMWSETIENYAPLEFSFIHSKTLFPFLCNFPISQFKFLLDQIPLSPLQIVSPPSLFKLESTPTFIEAGEEQIWIKWPS